MRTLHYVLDNGKPNVAAIMREAHRRAARDMVKYGGTYAYNFKFALRDVWQILYQTDRTSFECRNIERFAIRLRSEDMRPGEYADSFEAWGAAQR